MKTVIEQAEACRNRDFMWGFINGTISNGGDPFHLGTSECAIIERALRAVESDDSLVLHNPFPTTSLPVALIASYAYSQHPKIPGGGEKSMLVFPASSQGYLGELDEFHFSRVATAKNHKRPLIPREPIDSLSEQQPDWAVHTAKSGFVLDFDNPHVTPGAMFVDLQKPEWSERMFDHIEEFCERNPDMPVVFYTDEMGPAAELTCERLGTDPLRVTNELLASAPHSDSHAGESKLTTQERILTNGGVEVRQLPVNDEGLWDLLPDFIDLKNKCQDRDLAYTDVAHVFNRLTKQPFKPRYWSRTVGADGFYNDVPGYIDRIERRASNISRGSDMLYNYARAANELQGHLNDRHVLQNTVLDAIQRAGDDEGGTRFVVKNTKEREALRLAATDSGYVIPENVEITERKKVEPMPDARYVFLYPPYDDDYVYEFPPAKRVAFIHHALWKNYVGSAAKEATDGVNATHKTTSIGESGAVGDVDDHVFDIDALENDIEGYLRRTDFGVGSDDDDGSRLSRSGSSRGSGTVDITFHLTNGKTRSFSAEAPVTVYDSEGADITRKKAKNVTKGEELLLIDSVTGDLYDVLIKSAHKREAVREDENLVENWRNALDSGMDREGTTYADVVAELQRNGSEIESATTVKLWRDGQTIGPQAEGDCRRILHMFRPELEGELLEQIHEQVWKAMKHLRLLHRRMGRNVRRAVEAEFNSTTEAEFGGDINERMIRNIARDIERERVIDIE